MSRWDHFTDEEILAISSALWTTSEVYPDRDDHDVMVALRSETTPLGRRYLAARDAPRRAQSVPGRMSFTVLEKKR